MKRVAVFCECSGRVREALRRRGVDAWSLDLQAAEDGSEFHIQGDALDHLNDGWDAAVFHPECTRLTNAGVRWMKVPPPGKTLEHIWQEFEEACRFYLACRDADIAHKWIENPVMHMYARIRIKPGLRQIVQPHFFGDPFFKATGFEIINGEPLVRTHYMELPKVGTDEHKAWSAIHREPPSKDPAVRKRNRSRFFPGMSEALAAAVVRTLERNELEQSA